MKVMLSEQDGTEVALVDAETDPNTHPAILATGAGPGLPETVTHDGRVFERVGLCEPQGASGPRYPLYHPKCPPPDVVTPPAA